MVMVRGGGDALAVVHRQCIEDSFPSAVGVTNGSHPQPGEAVFVTSAVGCPPQLAAIPLGSRAHTLVASVDPYITAELGSGNNIQACREDGVAQPLRPDAGCLPLD